MKNDTKREQITRFAPNIYLLGALLSILMGFVAFMPIWLPNQGRLMEYGDYYPQYVPFLLEMKRMLQSGTLGWSWNSFLGDSYISAYSYYTVFNPFAWFVILFPESVILYATMAAALLKLAVGTVGAMLYLRQFVKKDIYALIGGLLYTFSGFTVVNTSFYFFQDVIAVFPWLLYGLERLIREKTCWIYILMVALNGMINFYFFVSTVFLVILYVLFRLNLYSMRGWKENAECFFRILLCSILGTGLAAIGLIPSLFSILNSGKAGSSFGNAGYVQTYSTQDLLERFRVLISPVESNTYHAFFDCSSWCSIAAYLPIFGCLPAMCQSIRKRDWLGSLLGVMLFCYVIPGLNSIFNLFTAAHYSRWLYGPVLLMALRTAQLLEDWEQTGQGISKKALWIYTMAGAALVLLPAGANILCSLGLCLGGGCESAYFFGNRAMAVMILLTVFNYLVLWYLVKASICRIKPLVACVVITCTVNYAVYNALNYNAYYETRYQKTLVEGIHEPETVYAYRIDHPEEILNYSLFQNQPSVHNYNSLQNMGSTKFALKTGFIHHMSTVFLSVPEESREELDALLSVRFFMDYDQAGNVPEGFVFQRTENGVDVYENSNYIPMGFTFDAYVLEEMLEELTPEERVRIMLSALVVSQEDAARVEAVLPLLQPTIEAFSLKDAVMQRNQQVCSFFQGTPQGFQAEIQLEKENVVFFSIPMDAGWEVWVNGEPGEVIQVHYGLMGILCKAGNNVIEARYRTKGLQMGMACSGVFAVIWTACGLTMYHGKRKNRGMG